MSASTQVADYLQEYRHGNRDEAFFGLLEMEHGILPILMATFRSERDCHVRAFLVEVIWQHRQDSVIPFLGEALQDYESEVWKQALDGLVSLASPAALTVLRTARSRRDESGYLHRWIDEAIDQVESEVQKA